LSGSGVLDLPYPPVFLGERIRTGPTDHVTMENAVGAVAATRHLLGLGRGRIAGEHEGMRMGSVSPRLEGHRTTLAEEGIGLDLDLLVFHGDWHRMNGADYADRARELLAHHVPVRRDPRDQRRARTRCPAHVPARGAECAQDVAVAVVGFDDVAEARVATAS